MTGGFFAVLDDIAVLLDDAAVMGKVAAKKTAGVLGDDLAVNAEKASGFHASRELPVLWAITKGSLVNKLIILPLALLMSAYLPWLIVPVLLLGGAYLGFEGVEKVYDYLFVRHVDAPETPVETLENSARLDVEKQKIKSAIITDFVLSFEIVMIALGTVMDKPLMLQVLVVSLIALLATVGVYGFVALLVRMDDTGLYLIRLSDEGSGGMRHRILRALGSMLVAALPKIIKFLSVVGTIAMLLVGGGLYVHNIEALHHYTAHFPIMSGELLVGLAVGSVVFAVEKAVHYLRHRS